MFFLWSVIIGLATVSSARSSNDLDCTGINGIKPQCKSKESSYQRDVFWVGGRYVNAAIGLLTYDQMYVEKLTPQKGIEKLHPVVLFHGGGVSGATWLNTPDNRKGFASMFLDYGYQVYVVDQTSVGRGTQEDLVGYPLRIGSTANISEAGFTAPQIANAYPQSQLHTQWPGTGLRGDPIFDAFESGFMPLTNNNTRQEISMRAAGCELLQLIGPSFLVSHSIGAIHPIVISDECPDLVLGNVNLEPGNIPFESYTGNQTSSVGRTAARPFGLTVANLNYDPPISSSTELITETVGEDTPEKRSCIQQSSTAQNHIIHTLPNIAKVPYVAFTGEASPHITYEHCVINYLNQVGVKADWIKMADVGVHGNAHFGFLEKNNVEYFEVVENWIKLASKGN
ncbi:95f3bf77-9847-4956-b62c-04ac4d009df1 [Sclerotinia trifoliorum]|uniref:95f3bf77-9847-4956-b62c-04ac4d009df1 n=1 Tax=Sclerotinia trifoliorum TaxID=28548 RepID=A0A8H2ZN29_9HELO|nr:95f3bf77-9847-4956-b62c-04ac4d009df1 [Sclerotinia trifoliorum]